MSASDGSGNWKNKNVLHAFGRRGVLPPPKGMPNHPTNEEYRNWYTVREEMELNKLKLIGSLCAAGDEEVVEVKKKPKWLLVDVLVRDNIPVTYSRTPKWGQGVAVGVGLKIATSNLKGLPKGKTRDLFATADIKSGVVVCGSIGVYMLETKKQHSKSDRVLKLSNTVGEQNLAVYCNIDKNCPSAIINDGIVGSKSRSTSRVNVRFVENVERSFNSTHYVTVVSTRDI